MSTEIDRIKQLHEQASERYLNGDYTGAIEAWNDVLSIDPGNDEALGGVRMATQFVEPTAPEAAAPSVDVESDLDEGLRILDGVGRPTLLSSDRVDGAVDRQAAPEGVAPDDEDVPEGWEPLAEPAQVEESYGLEPLSRSASAPAAPASAAAAELERRVDDLLTEAKAKADAGERDEALAILARLGILDEENAEADALRQKLEAAGASELDKVERAIIEGVAALEADRLDDAEQLFREALALSPEHREALHYMEKIEQRRAAGSEDLLATYDGEAAPADGAVQKATSPPPAEATKPIVPQKSKLPFEATDLPDAPIAASRPRASMPALKLLVGGALGAVLVAGAAITVPRMFRKSTPRFVAPPPAASAQQSPGGAKAPAGIKTAPAATAAVLTPQQQETVIASGIATGNSLMAAGDPGAAVIAFNKVLSMDPTNASARAGLTAAGEQYKATKAERDALSAIQVAFRDGEFSSGLRVAYRLPPTVSQSQVVKIKVAGWYNLAVIALRAGECHEAQKHLDEALDIDPSDEDAKSLRDLASRYADVVKDRAFLDRVEALSFRPFPAS